MKRVVFDFDAPNKQGERIVIRLFGKLYAVHGINQRNDDNQITLQTVPFALPARKVCRCCCCCESFDVDLMEVNGGNQ